MTIEAMGDSAWVLRGLSAARHLYIDSLRGVSGVLDAAASYETLAVFFDPASPPDEGAVRSALERPSKGTSLKLHVIPVLYEPGEDLDSVAEALELSIEEVIAAHTSQEFECRAIGFRPGFPYLGWLPEALQGIPRRPQPRLRVPRGSVAIADKQTGIYPEESPGGWSILGRTPLTIVDVASDYFPIATGDSVRFEAITKAQCDRLAGTRL